MGKWTKYFTEGTSYVGEDEAVARGEASCTRSMNVGVVGVDLEHGGVMMSIRGPGEYWQSDTYESGFPFGNTRLVARRIQRRVQVGDQYYGYNADHKNTIVWFDKRATGCSYRLIGREQIDKWFTLELNVSEGTISTYFSDNKL